MFSHCKVLGLPNVLVNLSVQELGDFVKRAVVVFIDEFSCIREISFVEGIRIL
jgi:hypothetical protein